MYKSLLKNYVINNTLKSLITNKNDQIFFESKRYARNIKPYNQGNMDLWKKKIYTYDYRKARAKKVLKVDLPNFDDQSEPDTKVKFDKIKTALKEKGIAPYREWREKPVYIGDSNNIIDTYIPPEGDSVRSIISSEGAKQKAGYLKEKSKDFLSLRKIKGFLEGFEPQKWCENESLKIYIEAHKALADRNEEKLYELVTDYCLPLMLHEADLKTIRWQFIKNLEIPNVVHIRHDDNKNGSFFAQITVRFHTQQTLAVYDKFGRLVNGSEAVLKDVLDYIVFENNLSSVYGCWKIHNKIIPEWDKSTEFSKETSVKIVEDKI